ncbi:hypothetical protein NBH19_16880 [Rhizobium sp. S95]|uniref:Protein argonaute n=1 Tax=Ciceribacter sichuanensis TaxID=2949647 RepID=A0AAJ1F7L2_9HYPH|nr:MULTISPECIES: hypothetical protein [unclassified Ciceribacter]MCM2397748.1 hypothetical protein [Ciceribacter sp. S95]MCO5960095.1 hypothetical protein [Ciceribacter sp. S101]
MTSELSPHAWYAEPKLAFHPERLEDTHSHPLKGLLRYGPYSSGIVPDPIRVATIAPDGDAQKLYEFLKELNSEIDPTERKDFIPKWPGFSKVFNVHMRAAENSCHVLIGKEADREVASSEIPYLLLVDRLTRALHSLESNRTSFDVVFIYVPTRWAPAYSGAPGDDFDLHDHLKAIAATRRIPIQLVREDKAISYPHRASVMWRLGLALYAKAGGVPWKLAETDTETAYIGLSYALRPTTSDKPRFVTCCSQVFDADGAGLEFVAYDAHDVEVQRDNPYLSRTEMFRVMTRSLELYRRRHAGKSPRRVFVHKSTEFKPEETSGCMEAFHLCETVDLIQIVEDVGWRGIRIDKDQSGGRKGNPANFPVMRGSLLPLGEKECLLWMHGSVGGVTEKGNYFQGARSTPKPIRLVRHAGHGAWDDTARSILALSKMNWNNDALYDPLPVTMSYAHVLARVVKRMTGLGTAPYQFRFFM